MIDAGKRSVLGVLVDCLDYDAAVERVLAAARARRPFAGTALAVHGVMEAVADPVLRHRVNHLDLVTPDGQPVRWALNRLYRAALPDRVYGPALMGRLLDRAGAEALPVFFYGSSPEVLDRLVARMRARHPDLRIAGSEASKFREAGPEELDEVGRRISASGAQLVFVGLGCPRQEVFAHEMRERVGIPLLAVGAAFDYHAGTRRHPPAFVQRAGLQWLWRLAIEPRRLWRRYCVLNPLYLLRLSFQATGISRPPTAGEPPPPAARIPV